MWNFHVSLRENRRLLAAMRFDFADLQLFICIVDAGSITQGASKAHLAVSSASERLKHMEQELGIALLVRHARGVTPTAVGEILLQHAKKIVQQQQQLKDELNQFASGKRGRIQFYANTSALSEFLPAKISAWLQQNPQLEIELKEQNTEDIVQKLQSGLIEAAMISNAVEHTGLIFKAIYADHLVLIVSAAHPFNGKKQINFHEIVNEAFVGLYESSALQLHIASQARKIAQTLNLRVRMNTFEGICEMVDKQVGVAIMPKAIAEKYKEKFEYNIIILQDNWAQRHLGLCYKNWEKLSPAMKNLLLYLQAS